MHTSTPHQFRRMPVAERDEASNFTISVVMAGIFAFFVAGIASAFIYAKDTNVAGVAPSPTIAAAPSTTAKSPPAETTGSGSVK